MKRFCMILAGIVFLAGFLGSFVVYIKTPPVHLPSFDHVKGSYKKSDALLRDRFGEVIHELRVNHTIRRMKWTSLDEVSPAAIQAIIRSEDRRFFNHAGVDPLATVKAFLGAVIFRQKRGASTITMQLSSFLEPSLHSRSGGRTAWQKWHQVIYALSLEKAWRKREILETYLNLVTFRGELQGITAASQGLFDKKPSGLTHDESIVLASLIRSPNASPENVIKRASALNLLMGKAGGQDRLATLVKDVLAKSYWIRQSATLAPHVAHILLKQGMEEVTSTIDGKLQRYATELLKEYILKLKEQNVNDGAIIVVENRTGDVLAYIGNAGIHSSAFYVDGARAKRQAGSTLKPFLYALAFDKKVLTAASLISDRPLDIPTERGIYHPENYDNIHRVLVPARTALASSLNIPAVRVLGMVGPDAFAGTLRQLGFTLEGDGEFYGHSLALGTLDVSLYELVNAYMTLARGGRTGLLTLTPSRCGHKNSSQRIFSEGAVFLITDILSDREARSITFSLESPLATRFFSAVKTGTSKDMRDNWCIGFSHLFTVGVWIGNFSGAAMWDVSGISGAAPVWHELMNYLHRGRNLKRKTPPAGIAAMSIEGAGRNSSSKREWFIKGTEPISIEPKQRRGKSAKIVYPPEDIIIAVDPDIPVDRQRVFFESNGRDSGTAWLLNGKHLGNGDLYPWFPVKGSYTLKLVDKRGRDLDEVRFTVR